jgi:hypothetical protein
MQKTKVRLFSQRCAVGARGFEQTEGAIDIGAHEIGRTVYGTVHMALGSKMQDRARLILPQQRRDQFAVADVAMDEMMTAVVGQRPARPSARASRVRNLSL